MYLLCSDEIISHIYYLGVIDPLTTSYKELIMDNYISKTISHFLKMEGELIKADNELLGFIRELNVENRNNRRAIAKLEQQLNDLRKELDGLKKTED